MEIRIADTFTSSLASLTADERKQASATAFELMGGAAGSGTNLHPVESSRDPNFWSARVSRDIRIILHRTPGSTLLCYVAHHDDAYAWATRRKLEVHPTTGAAQLVEIREKVTEIPVYVPAAAPLTPEVRATRDHPALLGHISERELLERGVPPEWLPDVRGATSSDQLEALVDHLPAEAGEAVLELATRPYGTPSYYRVALEEPQRSDPFDHPDAQRRFRVVANVEELERALEYPWDRWMVFLHPDQASLVQRDFAGPARVSGSAGTGKTIVALHRAVWLARANLHARVLLTTFSDALAQALRGRLRRLTSSEPRLLERIEVAAIDTVGQRLYEARFGKAAVAEAPAIEALLTEASAAVGGHRFTSRFLQAEWEQVVDAWQLRDWEGYRDVARLGRKTRLPEAQRAVLWSIFSRVLATASEQGMVTRATMFSRLASALAEGSRPVFEFAVIDESQDLGVPHLRFLAALGDGRPNSLFFAGDLGQRIFQQPFSWKSLGVDVRGRSRTLRVNYRTSHQIRRTADLLLGPTVTDVDGNEEDRSHTVSVFNGPAPDVRTFSSTDEELAGVGEWVHARVAEGVQAGEIGVFVRSEAQLERARRAVEAAEQSWVVLDERASGTSGKVAVGTMHLAKGLEFRAVAVMACDDEVIPLQQRIEEVGDEADLLDVYETERHLLYVACTRARDHLLVSGVEPASEFLDDMNTPRP